MNKFLSTLMLTVLVVCLTPSAWSQASTKARTFNGTSDNLQSAATIDLSASSIITISFWNWHDDDTGTQVWLETSADYGANNGAWAIYTGGTGIVNIDMFFNAGFAANFPLPSAGAWHHYMIVIDNSAADTVATAYVDGSSVTVTETNDTAVVGVFGNYTFNVMARNAASLFTAGRVSDIAIWASGLTSGNAATLANCANDPGDVGTVAFWWPIVQASPETASAGGVNLTVTGTTNSDSSCAAGAAPRARNCALLGVC